MIISVRGTKFVLKSLLAKMKLDFQSGVNMSGTFRTTFTIWVDEIKIIFDDKFNEH